MTDSVRAKNVEPLDSILQNFRQDSKNRVPIVKAQTGVRRSSISKNWKPSIFLAQRVRRTSVSNDLISGSYPEFLRASVVSNNSTQTLAQDSTCTNDGLPAQFSMFDTNDMGKFIFGENWNGIDHPPEPSESAPECSDQYSNSWDSLHPKANYSPKRSVSEQVVNEAVHATNWENKETHQLETAFPNQSAWVHGDNDLRSVKEGELYDGPHGPQHDRAPGAWGLESDSATSSETSQDDNDQDVLSVHSHTSSVSSESDIKSGKIKPGKLSPYQYLKKNMGKAPARAVIGTAIVGGGILAVAATPLVAVGAVSAIGLGALGLIGYGGYRLAKFANKHAAKPNAWASAQSNHWKAQNVKGHPGNSTYVGQPAEEVVGVAKNGEERRLTKERFQKVEKERNYVDQLPETSLLGRIFKGAMTLFKGKYIAEYNEAVKK